MESAVLREMIPHYSHVHFLLANIALMSNAYLRGTFYHCFIMVELFDLPDTILHSTLNFLDIKSLVTFSIVNKEAYRIGLWCLDRKFSIVTSNVTEERDLLCFLWAFRSSPLFCKWSIEKYPFVYLNDELLRSFVKLDPLGNGLLPYILNKYEYINDLLPQHEHYVSFMASSVYFSCLKNEYKGALLCLLDHGITVPNVEKEPLLCSLIEYGDLACFDVLLDKGVFKNLTGNLVFLKKTIEYLSKARLKPEQGMMIMNVKSLLFTKCLM
jgi:hypothetical protein